MLTKEPKLLLNDNKAGKPEGIHLMIGRRPRDGVRQLRPATSRCSNTPTAGDGARLVVWCCTTTRSANTPTARRKGLPATKVGAFTQALYDEAKKQGWVVISMKDDWKRISAFDP